jgi:predicted transcriptional regulator
MATTKNPTASRRRSASSPTSSPTSTRRAKPGDIESECTPKTKLLVGGSIENDAAAFLDAWHRAERGERVSERVLAFESWEGLASVMTGERYRLLRHLHQHPEPSVSSLARALRRQYRRVHADVAALEEAGLLDRSQGMVRTTADRISADIQL